MEEEKFNSELSDRLEPEIAEVRLPRVSQSSHLRQCVNRLRRKVQPWSIIETLRALESLREVLGWTERYSQGGLSNPLDVNSFGSWFAFYRDRGFLLKSIIEECGEDPNLFRIFGVEAEREIRFSLEHLISRKPEVRRRYIRLIDHQSELIEREVQQQFDEEIENALSIAVNGIPEPSCDEELSVGPGILFLAMVELPLFFEEEESSQVLFQRALNGDVESIEILARKDRMIGADAELGKVIQTLRRNGLDEPFRKYLVGNGGKPAADIRRYQGYGVKCLFGSLIIEESKRIKGLTEQMCGLAAGLRAKLGNCFSQKRYQSIDWMKYRSLKIPDVLEILRAWSQDRGVPCDLDLRRDDDSIRRNFQRAQRFVRKQNWDISFQG